jgi:hypothetical protein
MISMVANGRIGLYMGNGRSAISTRKLQMRDYNNQPPGGRGRLRALLASIGENAEERLTEDPRYKEGHDDGYDAGYAAAQANHRQLTKAIADVYRIETKGNE